MSPQFESMKAMYAAYPELPHEAVRRRRREYEAALAAPIRRPPTFLGTGGLWMLLDAEARCETWVSVYSQPETPTCYPGDAFMRIRMPEAA